MFHVFSEEAASVVPTVFIVFVTYIFCMYYFLFCALHFQTWGFFWVPWGSQKEPPLRYSLLFGFLYGHRIGSDRKKKNNIFFKIECVANCSSWWSASCAERRRHRAERLLGRVGSDRPAALDPQQLQDLFHRCWRHRVWLSYRVWGYFSGVRCGRSGRKWSKFFYCRNG